MTRRFLISFAAALLMIAALGAAADWHASDDRCALCQLRAHSPGMHPLLPSVVEEPFEQWSVLTVVVDDFAGLTAEHSSSRAPPRNS